MIDFRQVASLFIDNNEVSELWIDGNKVWEKSSGLTFTAEEANSTIAMQKVGSALDVSLEYSTGDGWQDFIVGETTVTLSNVGDECFIRAKTTNSTFCSPSNSNIYIHFIMTGKIAASDSIMYLLKNDGDLSVIPSLYCFANLFSGCTPLTTAPTLPATTITANCYQGMFNGCTSLTTAPELPATNLAQECYRLMFSGCSSLVESPELPATTLATSCYSYMFHNCTSLTQAPELPANTLTQQCYERMFNGCTSLTQAPELPSTALSVWCYRGMFTGCTSLVDVYDLPATTLKYECYASMFWGCKSLTTSPELPASAMVEGCYNAMFQQCSNLNEIKIGYTGNFSGSDVPTNAFKDWVQGVAADGTFYYDGEDTTTGNSAIPTGWTLIPSGLTFTAMQAGSTVAMTANGSAPSLSLEYSTDHGGTWNDFIVGQTTVTLANVGDRASIRAGSGGNQRISSGDNNCNVFTTSGALKVFGDLTMLLNPSGNVTSLYSNQTDCFNSIFKGSTIVDAEGLVLPVTMINCAGAYSNMFLNCTSLVKPPAVIPDIQLNNTWTFNRMFNGCTSLTSTPKMLVTNTNGQSSTFRNMFDGCTSLVDVDFDALTTARGEYCMGYTFQGCTSLASVEFPALDYIGVGNYAFRGTFSGCTSLTSAKFPKLREVINSRTMYGMFDSCSALETVDMGTIQTIQSYQTMDYVFSHCRSLVLIDFSKATGVPFLSNANAFNDTNSTFKIVVPDALYDRWIAANNWPTYASHIVKASEYVPAA